MSQVLVGGGGVFEKVTEMSWLFQLFEFSNNTVQILHILFLWRLRGSKVVGLKPLGSR